MLQVIAPNVRVVQVEVGTGGGQLHAPTRSAAMSAVNRGEVREVRVLNPVVGLKAGGNAIVTPPILHVGRRCTIHPAELAHPQVHVHTGRLTPHNFAHVTEHGDHIVQVLLTHAIARGLGFSRPERTGKYPRGQVSHRDGFGRLGKEAAQKRMPL